MIIFFFLREAFCGLEYAENCIFGRGFASVPTGGAQDADPLVGWGGDTLSRLHPTRRKRLDPRSGLPLHIVSGYATGLSVLDIVSGPQNVVQLHSHRET